jgi:hypothetical protein
MDASLSDLCKRCRDLEFDDSKIGHRGGTESGGYFLQANDSSNSGVYSLCYELSDSLPDLPILSESSRGGCSFCSILRQAIVQDCNLSKQNIKVTLDLCFKSVYNPDGFTYGGLRSLVASVLLVNDDQYGA